MKETVPWKVQKNLLSIIYCKCLACSRSSTEAIADQLHVDLEYVTELCEKMVKEGLITEKGNQYFLTNDGRLKIRVVLAGGVFDIIHPGHIYTLCTSKELGDVLVVSVARDKTVSSNKGLPLNDERKRVELVASLKYVDIAILGSETDIFDTIIKIQPDIIALGYDQKHNEQQLADEAKKRGLNLKVVRVSSPIPHIKSSLIIKNNEVISEF